MKSNHIAARVVALTFLTLGTASHAVDEHHPESASATAKAAPKAPTKAASQNTPKENKNQVAKMDAQMKAMRDMHEKMKSAKTPEQRQALMDEHHKAMRNGMSMMNSMMAKDSTDKQARSPEMMQKQMDMMQMMTEMMKDQMGSQAPSK